MEYYRFPRIGARDVARDATRSDSGSSPLLPRPRVLLRQKNTLLRAKQPHMSDGAHAPRRAHGPPNRAGTPAEAAQQLTTTPSTPSVAHVAEVWHEVWLSPYTRDPPVHRNLNVEDTSVGNSY